MDVFRNMMNRLCILLISTNSQREHTEFTFRLALTSTSLTTHNILLVLDLLDSSIFFVNILNFNLIRVMLEINKLRGTKVATLCRLSNGTCNHGYL